LKQPAVEPARNAYSMWLSMIGPNNCHFSPVNRII
jgi:hypothetical protein